MGLSVAEQETSIIFMRDSDICEVYTSDSTVMTKFDKLVKSDKAPYWKLNAEYRLQTGELVGKTYQTHKRLISFWTDITTRELTNEQKEAAADRMKEWHEMKRQKKSKSNASEEAQICTKMKFRF